MFFLRKLLLFFKVWLVVLVVNILLLITGFVFGKRKCLIILFFELKFFERIMVLLLLLMVFFFIDVLLEKLEGKFLFVLVRKWVVGLWVLVLILILEFLRVMELVFKFLFFCLGIIVW